MTIFRDRGIWFNDCGHEAAKEETMAIKEITDELDAFALNLQDPDVIGEVSDAE